jgi:hypothetical protein
VLGRCGSFAERHVSPDCPIYSIFECRECDETSRHLLPLAVGDVPDDKLQIGMIGGHWMPA